MPPENTPQEVDVPQPPDTSTPSKTAPAAAAARPTTAPAQGRMLDEPPILTLKKHVVGSIEKGGVWISAQAAKYNALLGKAVAANTDDYEGQSFTKAPRSFFKETARTTLAPPVAAVRDLASPAIKTTAGLVQAGFNLITAPIETIKHPVDRFLKPMWGSAKNAYHTVKDGLILNPFKRAQQIFHGAKRTVQTISESPITDLVEKIGKTNPDPAANANTITAKQIPGNMLKQTSQLALSSFRFLGRIIGPWTKPLNSGLNVAASTANMGFNLRHPLKSTIGRAYHLGGSLLGALYKSTVVAATETLADITGSAKRLVQSAHHIPIAGHVLDWAGRGLSWLTRKIDFYAKKPVGAVDKHMDNTKSSVFPEPITPADAMEEPPPPAAQPQPQAQPQPVEAANNVTPIRKPQTSAQNPEIAKAA